jgi:LysR family hydrogen peroxide-inducible transcriptional activator
MTITQIEYVLAVGQHRNFRRAAEACFVTQPTLSAQIQKLEDELDVLLFDRSKSPVTPTRSGRAFLNQAQITIMEVQRLKEVVEIEKDVVCGDLTIGVIPTIAPYLIPRFLKKFHMSYPQLNLHVHEMTTANCLKALDEENIDVAILATKESKKKYSQTKLFDEEMFLYLHPDHDLNKYKHINVGLLKAEEMWLLEEGHCFRDDIVRVCQMQRQLKKRPQNLDLKVGNLETLKYLVESNFGYTLLPNMATLRMSKHEKKFLRGLDKPVPKRPVYICCRRKYLKRKAIEALEKAILDSVPAL